MNDFCLNEEQFGFILLTRVFQQRCYKIFSNKFFPECNIPANIFLKKSIGYPNLT